MALLSCPECGHEVSDRAKVCMNCGFPMAEEKETLEFEKYVTENATIKSKSEIRKIIDSIEMGNIEYVSYSEIFNELFDENKVCSLVTPTEKVIFDEWLKREMGKNIKEAVDVNKLNEYKELVAGVINSFNTYKQRGKLYSDVFDSCSECTKNMHGFNEDEKHMVGLITWGVIFSLMELKGVDDLGAASIWIEKKICEMTKNNFEENGREELYQLITIIIPSIVMNSKAKFERDFPEACEDDIRQCFYYAVNIINLLGNSVLTSKIKNEIKSNSNLAKRLINEGIDENYYFEINIKKISFQIEKLVYGGEYSEYLKRCDGIKEETLKQNSRAVIESNKSSVNDGKINEFLIFALKVMMAAAGCIFLVEIFG